MAIKTKKAGVKFNLIQPFYNLLGVQNLFYFFNQIDDSWQVITITI